MIGINPEYLYDLYDLWDDLFNYLDKALISYLVVKSHEISLWLLTLMLHYYTYYSFILWLFVEQPTLLAKPLATKSYQNTAKYALYNDVI